MQITPAYRVAIGALILVGVVLVYFISVSRQTENLPPVENEEIEVPITTPEAYEIIGTSVEGRAIEAYSYGDGETTLLFVGGIHGGYEWNSVVLAYAFMDYLHAYGDTIPENVKVTVIPTANPDGLYKVIGKEGRFTPAEVPEAPVAVGTGRFNAHDVDLNRNFDCKWKSTSMWRGNSVSAGTEAFSEPEAVAIRDFVLRATPAAAVFLHSQGNAVYASECHAGVLPETHAIMNVYAQAAGYQAIASFDAYEVTGDAEGWLASIGIPALTVELATHETIEWDKNINGLTALLQHYAQ